tara:strand:+ start:424 stop:576 length:153 start_codon:yes stop_codon:yes gene_type:complete
MITLGPISGALIAIGTNLGALEAIPIIGIPFYFFDYLIGFIAGFFVSIGL